MMTTRAKPMAAMNLLHFIALIIIFYLTNYVYRLFSYHHHGEEEQRRGAETIAINLVGPGNASASSGPYECPFYYSNFFISN
jgi:hypothetical protein